MRLMKFKAKRKPILRRSALPPIIFGSKNPGAARILGAPIFKSAKGYWGDSDKDGVINGLDCAPHNKKKQGPQHQKYIVNITKTSRPMGSKEPFTRYDDNEKRTFRSFERAKQYMRDRYGSDVNVPMEKRIFVDVPLSQTSNAGMRRIGAIKSSKSEEDDILELNHWVDIETEDREGLKTIREPFEIKNKPTKAEKLEANSWELQNIDSFSEDMKNADRY